MQFSNIQAILGVLVLLAGPVAADETSSGVPAQGCDFLPDQQRSTIVIFEPSSGRKLVCNEQRSKKQFVPASTYKIPHAIIAFETGAVVDEHAMFPWDGKSRGVQAWDKHLSLAEAVPASAVWVFQAIAQRVGQERESAWVKKLKYGNGDVGTENDLNHFWLSGPLKISAVEQVDFLHRLQSGSLDAEPSAMERTIDILKMDTVGNVSLYGKTGAMLPVDDAGFLRINDPDLLPSDVEHTGWFVGWIDRNDSAGGPVFFSLNLDLDIENAMKMRTAATFSILEANGFTVPNSRPVR